MNLHAFLLDASTRKREISSYAWVIAPTPAEAKKLATAIAFYEANYAQRNLLDDPTMTRGRCRQLPRERGESPEKSLQVFPN
jgi:hypothetical protein